MTLKQLLEKKNIKQIELAKQMEISRQLLSAWIVGRAKPSLENLVKLRKILKVNYSTLIKAIIESERR